MDYIYIEAVELDCIVGIRPRERRNKQLVRVDLRLGLNLRSAGRSGRIADTLDYDLITDEICSLLRFREYQLIEGATEELAAMLLGVHTALETVQIRLGKPTALQGRARNAAVQVERDRTDFPRPSSFPAGSGVRVQVLWDRHEAGLYLHEIPVGAELLLGGDSAQRHLGWVVTGQVCQGVRRLGRGAPLTPAATPYVNDSTEVAQVFSCSCPPFSSGLEPRDCSNRAPERG
jgi:dihydroneopterin aldolase